MKKKIYVGCSLTRATPEFRSEVFRLRDELLSGDFEMLEFGWDPKTDETTSSEVVNVYDQDVEKIDKCDVFVAICDEPAIGLGMELERAVNRRVPILAFKKPESVVTRIVEDSLLSIGIGKLYEYNSVEEIAEIVKREVAKL